MFDQHAGRNLMTDTLQTVFITGAGRRLGLHLVKHYLALGWRVIAHYRTNNELLEEYDDISELDGRYFSFQADLSSLSDVESLSQQLVYLLTGNNIQLDSIIHNASCFFPDNKSDSFLQRWQKSDSMMAVHVNAPHLLTELLASQMKDNSHITIMSDIYADLPNARFARYCSAKAAGQNLALSLAQTLAPKIRVNVIQPGPIKFLPEHDHDYREMVLSQSLIKKELGYEAIQQGIDYLVQASAVTGSILRIDGGRASANRYEQLFK